MFYAHFVLSKKGPLARIWLAAHWDKKLTRSQVFETNITSSVEAILEPKVKLALRTSGHLLLGVVRIHSRQAKYLLSDCNEAFVKIKMAFRPGADLTDDTHRDTTSLAAITLSDNIHDFESTLADINDMDPFGIAVNQSRPEDITMREEFGEPNLGRPDDDFGDSTFEDAGDRDFVGEPMNMDSMEDNIEADMTLTNELAKNQSSHNVFPEMPSSVGLGNNDSDFADVMEVDYEDADSVENMDMFQDTVNQVNESISAVESRLLDGSGSSSIDGSAGNTTSSLLVKATSELPTVIEEEPVPTPTTTTAATVAIATGINEPSAEHHLLPVSSTIAQQQQHHQPHHHQQQPPPQQQQIQQTTQQQPARQLPQFVLPPIDRALRENRRTPKRKRKLLIDEHKSIPSDVMKLQMQDTNEITTRLDLAPPTRKLMLWKETGNVEALFTTPGRAIPSRILQKLFYRNMRTVAVPNDAPDGLPVIPGMRRCGGFLQPNDVVDSENCCADNVSDTNRGDGDNDCWSQQQQQQRPRDQLCSISEEGAVGDTGTGGIVPENTDLGMPEGACSSYSTNYDYWSNHATPHRPDFDDNEPSACPVGFGEDDPMMSIMMPSPKMATTVGAAATIGDNGLDCNPLQVASLSPATTSVSVTSILLQQPQPAALVGHDMDIPIEKARGAGLQLHDLSSINNSNAFANSDLSGLSIKSVDRTILSNDDSNNMNNESHNKLQITMVMLDQQLDMVNEEYPMEITQEGLEKRSEIMLTVLRKAIMHDGRVDFQHLTVSNNKKQAASKFYTLLLLGKQKKLKMFQDTPISNIIITNVESD